MKFNILTLFPQMINDSINHSIIKKAISKGIVNINCIDIRNFANNKANKVDYYPYGGGSGMVLQPEPIKLAYEHVLKSNSKNHKLIFLSPQGKTLTQKKVEELSKEEEIILLCGHYEGIDQRVLDEIVTEEISIGDYILTGGEIAALVLIDSVSRLLPGVLGSSSSHEKESFSEGILEHPHYTRPQSFNGKKVPEVLLSGNHSNIDKWRREQSILNTLKKRPELLKKYNATQKEEEFIKKFYNQ